MMFLDFPEHVCVLNKCQNLVVNRLHPSEPFFQFLTFPKFLIHFKCLLNRKKIICWFKGKIKSHTRPIDLASSVGFHLSSLRARIMGHLKSFSNYTFVCRPCQEKRKDTTLCLHIFRYFPSTLPSAGRGRPRLYGHRFNPRQIDAKYRVSTETHENITTAVYQAKLRHKKFPGFP